MLFLLYFFHTYCFQLFCCDLLLLLSSYSKYLGTSQGCALLLAHNLISLLGVFLPHISASTVYQHLLYQRLLSLASRLICLCVASNSLNNLFWFDSNKGFSQYCSVLLSYLSSFSPTAANLCRTFWWTTSTSFWHWVFFSNFDMMPLFCNSFRLVMFNCLNSFRNAFCFSKISLPHFCCLFSVISLFWEPTISAIILPAACSTEFVFVIVSVFMRKQSCWLSR